MKTHQTIQTSFTPKNYKLKTKTFLGFTLVELIVVIVILAILATIAFLSFGSQSAGARNSSRAADINNATKSLELFYIKAGTYPSPDNSFSVTYLGGDLWYQGTIGDSLTKRLGTLSKKIVDPLDNTEYNYSKLAYGNSYQITADFEGDISALNNNTNNNLANIFQLDSNNQLQLQNTYAASGSTLTTYIKGNYYSAVAKTITGSIIYLVATPSISTTLTTTTEITSDNLSGTLLVNGKQGTTGITYNPNKLVFSGATLPKDDTASGITNMMNNIVSAYAGTEVVTTIPAIKEIVNTPTTQLASLGSLMISTHLGSSATAPVVVTGWGTNTGSNNCTAGSYTSAGTQTYTLATTLNDSLFLTGTTVVPITGGNKNYSAKLTCNTGIITVSNESFTTSCTSGYTVSGNSCIAIGTTSANPGLSCNDIKTKIATSTDGLYWIKPDANAAFQVYCDMTTSGGGRTVIFNSNIPTQWKTNSGTIGTGNWSQDFTSVGITMNSVILIRVPTGETMTANGITKANLYGCTKGTDYWWNGSLSNRYNGYHLGISNDTLYVGATNNGFISGGYACNNDRQSWGFGHRLLNDDIQAYGWNSANLGPTVFRIGIK